ncbi:MAG: Mrp/NBP35 family ATP-binding protein [Candidatus Hydrothermarchaeaceae archaeon]
MESESEVVRQVTEQMQRVKDRMSKVEHKIAVMSGKGGVGKSVVTVNLALAMAQQGYKVGILDADINGPCVPKMLGIKDQHLKITPDGAIPASAPLGIKVASMDLLLQSEEAPVIWEGPVESSAVWQGAMEMSVIREFLSDVAWGKLDYLLIDLPPGTGNKPSTLVQLIPDLGGAIVVTIPSEVSKIVVKKSITLARELKIPIIGLIENMSGFTCPECNVETELFTGGDGKKLSREVDTQVLGKIPFDRRIGLISGKGMPFMVEHEDAPAAKACMQIAEKIIDYLR